MYKLMAPIYWSMYIFFKVVSWPFLMLGWGLDKFFDGYWEFIHQRKGRI